MSQVASNLKLNERRLTTPFDIHATLTDILRFGGDERKPGKVTSRAISLFDEVRLAVNYCILQYHPDTVLLLVIAIYVCNVVAIDVLLSLLFCVWFSLRFWGEVIA